MTFPIFSSINLVTKMIKKLTEPLQCNEDAKTLKQATNNSKNQQCNQNTVFSKM